MSRGSRLGGGPAACWESRAASRARRSSSTTAGPCSCAGTASAGTADTPTSGGRAPPMPSASSSAAVTWPVRDRASSVLEVTSRRRNRCQSHFRDTRRVSM